MAVAAAPFTDTTGTGVPDVAPAADLQELLMRTGYRARAVAAEHPGWSAHQVADAAGCSPAYVYMLGLGRRERINLNPPIGTHDAARRAQEQVLANLEKVTMVVGTWGPPDADGVVSREIRGV
jgi:hypothetical protein